MQRLINTDRNHFAASMVALGDADGMVTGLTRNYSTALEDVRRCIDPKPGHRVIGVSIALCRGRTVLVADTAVHDMPTSEELADIAEEAAGLAKRLGYVPRVAMLAYSTFGHPSGERSERVREAVKILDRRRVDFEYDGEMAADVALNARVMEQYPFCRLSAPRTCSSCRLPLGLDLDEDAPGAGRLDRDRPAAGRPRQVGPDRLHVGKGLRPRQPGRDRCYNAGT